MKEEQFNINTPIMETAKFAEQVGVSTDTMRGMVESDRVPTIKIGKRRFINIAALTHKCLEAISNTAK